MSTNKETAAAADIDLKSALDSFEVSLATPMVSGELADWLQQVELAWSKLSDLLHNHIEHSHVEQFSQIEEQDLELLPKVEQLRAEDKSILEECDALNRAVARTTSQAPKLEPDEEKARQHTKSLVDAGIALVTRVRKQEVALQTWYVEAFNRDRGAVD
jgi:hypothetical protein